MWPPPFEITAALLIQSFYLTKLLSGTSFTERFGLSGSTTTVDGLWACHTS